MPGLQYRDITQSCTNLNITHAKALLKYGKTISLVYLHSALLFSNELIINEQKRVDKSEISIHCHLHFLCAARCSNGIRRGPVEYRESGFSITPTVFTLALYSHY